jgi:hypothetical protein
MIPGCTAHTQTALAVTDCGTSRTRLAGPPLGILPDRLRSRTGLRRYDPVAAAVMVRGAWPQPLPFFPLQVAPSITDTVSPLPEPALAA